MIHLRQSDTLNADSGQDLLVGEGEEEFARDEGGGAGAKVQEDDGSGEAEGEEVCDYEGEEDLGEG